MASKKINSPLLIAGLGILAIGGFYYANQNDSSKNVGGSGGIVGYLKPGISETVNPLYETTTTTTESRPITLSNGSNAFSSQATASDFVFTETNPGSKGSSGGGGGVITKKGQKVNPSFKANDPTGIYTPIENINSGDIKIPKPNTNKPKTTTKKKSSTVGGSNFLKRIGSIFSGGLL